MGTKVWRCENVCPEGNRKNLVELGPLPSRKGKRRPPGAHSRAVSTKPSHGGQTWQEKELQLEGLELD